MDHHRTTIFQVPKREGDCFTLLHGDQNARMAPLDLALVRGVFVEDAVHDRGAARVGQQLTLITDQAACRRMENHARTTDTRRAHVQHVGLALGQFLHDHAGMLVIHIDDDFLDWLKLLAVRAFLHHDLRT